MAADELAGGRLGNLDDSLAQYLADAFDFIGQNDFDLDPLTLEARDELMLLCLSIGRGVVRYLRDHAAAFVIDDHNDVEEWEHDSTKRGHVRIRADGGLHPS